MLVGLVAAGCPTDSSEQSCTAGQAVCFGNEVHRCNGAGTGYALEQVCGDGEVCKTGACVASTCGNGVCDADESCTSCFVDCGACPKVVPKPKPDDGGTSGDGGTNPTGPCLPQQPNAGFCDGEKAMKCDADGVGATLSWDCDNLDFPGVNFSCVECTAKDYATCDNDKAVWTSGTVTGPVSFSYSARTLLHSGCNYTPFHIAHTWFATGSFRHHASIEIPGGDDFDIRIEMPAPVSGVVNPLFTQIVPAFCSLTLHDAATPDINWRSDANLDVPPDVGTVKLTFSGQSLGDTWSLDIDGYVKKYDAQGETTETWQKATYQASGIVTGMTWPP